MKKENIDKLYQEKLKDFKEVPDEKVWKAISASLDKGKRNRRIVPLWWKLGGVAALLAILLYVFIPLNNNSDSDEIITDVESVTPIDNSGADDIENALPDDTDEGRSAVANSTETEKEKTNVIPSKDSNMPSSGVLNGEASIAKSIEKKNLKQENRTDMSGITATETGISSVYSENTRGQINKDEVPETNTENRSSENKNAGMASSTAKESSDAVSQQILTNKETQKGIPAIETDKTGGVATKNTDKEEEKPENDKPMKSIFDEIENPQETELAENKSNKWSVGPSIGPVYFNSFGSGSPIHSNFVANSKTGNVNLSYGLTVSYGISKKLSIRSGLHKVDYSYDTNEISFSASISASTNNQIDNINYVSTSKNLVVRNTEDSKLSQQASSLEVAAKNPARDGRMVQDFGYLELPVEIKFALLDHKFGVNLIGGLSSLFLVDNSVVLQANGNTVEMGEANNINDVNLSTNIGFGLNYKFSPTLQLNLEPMFKYQLNTFSQSAGDFQPFSIGVYTGLNFKF
jgi:hypothetical protein